VRVRRNSAHEIEIFDGRTRSHRTVSVRRRRQEAAIFVSPEYFERLLKPRVVDDSIFTLEE
jgi:hypothetical protein